MELAYNPAVSTSTLERTDSDLRTGAGEGHYTHIVPGDDKHTGIELVMQARVNGTAVTALCGHTWIPSRDAKKYPICSRCKAIYDAASEEFGLGDRDPREIRS